MNGWIPKFKIFMKFINIKNETISHSSSWTIKHTKQPNDSGWNPKWDDWRDYPCSANNWDFYRILNGGIGGILARIYHILYSQLDYCAFRKFQEYDLMHSQSLWSKLFLHDCICTHCVLWTDSHTCALL